MYIYNEKTSTLDNLECQYNLNTGSELLPEFVVYLVEFKEGKISLQEAFDYIKLVGIEE